jgi:O-antigen ligase
LKNLLIPVIGLALLTCALLFRPGYLANPEVLGEVIAAQILLLALCKYKQLFFPVLMFAFLWAGLDVPLSGSWLQGRWIVLAAGMLAGAAIFLHEGGHHFGLIHLCALACVLSAVVSASVSAYPAEALLKSLSVFLLFGYAATGARIAVPHVNPERFFHWLLIACEATTYISFAAYFIFRHPLFGNPNSFGAVMGVAVVPALCWGFLCAESVTSRGRLGAGLCLAIMLLMSSYARAGIGAAAIACTMLCVGAQRYRLLAGGCAAAAAIALLTAWFVPLPVNTEDPEASSVATFFLYKGKPGEGLMASRKGPWDQTVSVIKEHPWFGSGFGTSFTERNASYYELRRTRFIDSRMVREHGNSYLAILEWSGLLGVVPFYLLIGTAVSHVWSAFGRLKHTGEISAPSAAAAAIVIAGLVNAAFEDWLFAVGYYVCVFVWAVAFILADLLHADAAVECATSISQRGPLIEVVAAL